MQPVLEDTLLIIWASTALNLDPFWLLIPATTLVNHSQLHAHRLIQVDRARKGQ